MVHKVPTFVLMADLTATRYFVPELQDRFICFFKHCIYSETPIAPDTSLVMLASKGFAAAKKLDLPPLAVGAQPDDHWLLMITEST